MKKVAMKEELKKVLIDLVKRFTSRKFLMVTIAIGVLLLNARLKILDLSVDDVRGLTLVVVSYVLTEGFIDSRAKK